MYMLNNPIQLVGTRWFYISNYVTASSESIAEKKGRAVRSVEPLDSEEMMIEPHTDTPVYMAEVPKLLREHYVKDKKMRFKYDQGNCANWLVSVYLQIFD